MERLRPAARLQVCDCVVENGANFVYRRPGVAPVFNDLLEPKRRGEQGSLDVSVQGRR
jgi:hypothetical protein